MKQILHYMACTLAATLTFTASLRADQPAPVTPAPPAPAAPKSGDGPRIKFDNDVFDAGKATAGQPLNHSFIFTNVGNQTLEVTKVNPTCGCTVAGTWTKKVEPGETGTIPISVNVNQAWNGQMMKTVTVESNDKSRPGPASISVKFNVWKPIEINQQYVFLNIPPESTNEVSTIVRIDNNTEQPFDLYDVQSSTPAIALQVKTNEAGKHYELLVKAMPPFKQGNNASGQISGKTTSTNMPSLAIGATVNVMPVININPPQVVLEAAPFTNVVHKPVTIQYTGSKSFHLSNPVFSAKGVDVELNESQPGKVFTVTLTFPPGFESNGRPMELTLDSSSPQMPLIKVPVNQLPRQPHPITPVKPATAGLVPPQARATVR